MAHNVVFHCLNIPHQLDLGPGAEEQVRAGPMLDDVRFVLLEIVLGNRCLAFGPTANSVGISVEMGVRLG